MDATIPVLQFRSCRGPSDSNISRIGVSAPNNIISPSRGVPSRTPPPRRYIHRSKLLSANTNGLFNTFTLGTQSPLCLPFWSSDFMKTGCSISLEAIRAENSSRHSASHVQIASTNGYFMLYMGVYTWYIYRPLRHDCF
jgi:hypothetical protein